MSKTVKKSLNPYRHFSRKNLEKVPTVWRRKLRFLRSDKWKRYHSVMKHYDGLLIPHPSLIFLPLRTVPSPSLVRVLFVLPSPHWKASMCDGLAISCPNGVTAPENTRIFFRELTEDVGIPLVPKFNTLLPWCDRGILLWNDQPIREHRLRNNRSREFDFSMWRHVTRDIVKAVAESDTRSVIVLVGASTQAYRGLIEDRTRGGPKLIISVGYPSERFRFKGEQRSGLTSFTGSKVFSKIADFLGENSSLLWRRGW